MFGYVMMIKYISKKIQMQITYIEYQITQSQDQIFYFNVSNGFQFRVKLFAASVTKPFGED